MSNAFTYITLLSQSTVSQIGEILIALLWEEIETWKAYRTCEFNWFLNLQLHTSSFICFISSQLYMLKASQLRDPYHFNFPFFVWGNLRGRKWKTIITYRPILIHKFYWWVRIQGQSRKGWFSFSTALPQITQQLPFFLFCIQVLRGEGTSRNNVAYLLYFTREWVLMWVFFVHSFLISWLRDLRYPLLERKWKGS